MGDSHKKVKRYK